MYGERSAPGVQPEQGDCPTGRANEVEHAPDRCGLARAVGTEEAEDLATLHLKRDVAHGSHRRPPRIGLDKVRDLDDRHRHSVTSARHPHAFGLLASACSLQGRVNLSPGSPGTKVTDSCRGPQREWAGEASASSPSWRIAPRSSRLVHTSATLPSAKR